MSDTKVKAPDMIHKEGYDHLSALSEALYNKCIHVRTREDGELEIACQLGLWHVRGKNHQEIKIEAHRYWLQYYIDGEYDKLLKDSVEHKLIYDETETGCQRITCTCGEVLVCAEKMTFEDWNNFLSFDLHCSHLKEYIARKAEEGKPVTGLTWNKWTDAKDVPIGKWLLVEIEDDAFTYQTAIFRCDRKGHPFGSVGGRFHFDCKIKRWADMTHLLTNQS